MDKIKIQSLWVFSRNLPEDMNFYENDVLRLAEYESKIQGDSEGICTTLGNDSMSDSKQKSS